MHMRSPGLVVGLKLLRHLTVSLMSCGWEGKS